MHFFVGTTNKAKLEAVKQATQDQWPDATIVGYEVESGVPSQPMTDDETVTGAQNRAKAALEKGQEEYPTLSSSECLGIGLEGGVTLIHNELWSTVWAAVTDISGEVFTANGARMKLALQIAQPILNGAEMGPLMEKLMGIENVRQKQGMLGIVTKNYVTRTEEYGGIAKLAIGLWFGKEWTKEIV
jgi:inosine/xanthosine triphosphatase